MVKEIPLTNGGVALVDDSVYELLVHYNWRTDKRGHVVTNVAGMEYRMNRVVKNCRRGDPPLVHKNRNLKDCRLANLRYRKGGEADAVR